MNVEDLQPGARVVQPVQSMEADGETVLMKGQIVGPAPDGDVLVLWDPYVGRESPASLRPADADWEAEPART